MKCRRIRALQTAEGRTKVAPTSGSVSKRQAHTTLEKAPSGDGPSLWNTVRLLELCLAADANPATRIGQRALRGQRHYHYHSHLTRAFLRRHATADPSAVERAPLQRKPRIRDGVENLIIG
jgi:hypothetical protein